SFYFIHFLYLLFSLLSRCVTVSLPLVFCFHCVLLSCRTVSPFLYFFIFFSKFPPTLSFFPLNSTFSRPNILKTSVQYITTDSRFSWLRRHSTATWPSTAGAMRFR